MLSGNFVNCYGIKSLNLTGIDFNLGCVSVLYAPNGAMKTSLAKVFDDISKGKETQDNLFPELPSSYTINYRGQRFESADLHEQHSIYVIQSFDEKFVSNQNSVTSLLADAATKARYDEIMAQFSDDIKQFKIKLSVLTGLTKPRVEETLRKDFDLNESDDWPTILLRLRDFIRDNHDVNVLDGIIYNDCINDKTESVVTSPGFATIIQQYSAALDELLSDNPVLNGAFNDYHAENLGKQFKKFNLFLGQHTVHLRDGREIQSAQQWDTMVQDELNRLYDHPDVRRQFIDIRKTLNASAETQKLCQIIVNHRELIPLLSEWRLLKKLFWVSAIQKMDTPFDTYDVRITRYAEEIRAVYEVANQQAEHWTSVVDEFNRRFKVPFSVRLENRANVLLRGEAPNIVFDYYNGNNRTGLTAEFKKDELMQHLSMGERRAMYLLYILFDIESVKERAATEHVLVIADDIADSFDYKNKYAIVEYLRNIAEVPNIDLLALTHNFDFYRTLLNRLKPYAHSTNCLIAQRREDGEITVTMMRYQRDFFENVVIHKLTDLRLSDDEHDKYLIVSIPFYRNLCEYALLKDDYKKLTCLLHLKTGPTDTATVKMSDALELIPAVFRQGITTNVSEDLYLNKLESVAKRIASNDENEVILENKILMSMAIRLEAELFLKGLLVSKGIALECNSNQTQEWSKRARIFLSPEKIAVIDEVNLTTAEGIHINSFMFEPIIDMSDWMLRDLYVRVLALNNKTL